MQTSWYTAKLSRCAKAHAGIRNIATGYDAEHHPKAILLIYVLSSLDRSLPFVRVWQPISLLLLSLLRHTNVAHMDSIVEMQQDHHRQYYEYCYSGMLLH